MIRTNLLNVNITKKVNAIKADDNVSDKSNFKNYLQKDKQSCSNKIYNECSNKQCSNQIYEGSNKVGKESNTKNKIKDSNIQKQISKDKNKNDIYSNLDELIKMLQDLINLLNVDNSNLSMQDTFKNMIISSDTANLEKNLYILLSYLKNNLNDVSKANIIKNKLLQNIRFNGDKLVVNSNKVNELVSQLDIINREIYSESNLLRTLNNNTQGVVKSDDSQQSLLKDIKNLLLKISNDNKELSKSNLKNEFKNLASYNTKFNLESHNSSQNLDIKSSELNKDLNVLNDIINNTNSKNDSKVESKVNRILNVMANISNLDSVQNFEISSKMQNLIVNRNNFVGDIIKTVNYMTANNLKNLTVKIIPKELGEIVISMISQDGNMKLAMKTSNKDTLNLLNANLNDIVNQLNSQNIKIQPSQISIYNEDASFFANQFNQHGNSNGNSNNKSSQTSFNLLNDNNGENDDESVITKLYNLDQINTFV